LKKSGKKGYLGSNEKKKGAAFYWAKVRTRVKGAFLSSRQGRLPLFFKTKFLANMPLQMQVKKLFKSIAKKRTYKG